MRRAVCYMFRLYLTGNTPNSVQASVNLNAICRIHLPGAYKIEVVDVAKDPDRALTDGIYMTPSLLKFAPSPARMIVGTLSRTDLVLEELGLPAPV